MIFSFIRHRFGRCPVGGWRFDTAEGFSITTFDHGRPGTHAVAAAGSEGDRSVAIGEDFGEAWWCACGRAMTIEFHEG